MAHEEAKAKGSLPPGKGKPNLTIKDVAKAAGVSYATVSRAMNRSKEISPRTREHILKVAEEIGYRPNAIARSLVNKRSCTIALIVPDISYSFFSEIALAAEDEVNNQGYSMFLCNSRWDVENERRLLATVQENCVDGIILHLASSDVGHIQNLGIPLVLLGCHYDQDFSYVEVNNRNGGREGTQCLIDSGYRRIACLTGMRSFLPYDERSRGYIDALQQASMPLDETIICHDLDGVEPGYALAQSMLRTPNPPDAFFCSNDLIAMGVWQCVVDMGLKIPEQVGICGFDDSDIARLPQIQMTSVAQPVREIGQKAASILFEAIHDQQEQQMRSLILPTELKKRVSTDKQRRS